MLAIFIAGDNTSEKQSSVRRIIIIVVLGVGLLLCGCCDKVNSTIEGFWSVDLMEYKGHNIMPCVLVNAISFSNNNKGNLPSPNNDCDSLFKSPVFLSQTTKEVIKKGNCQWKALRNSPYPVTLVFKSNIEAYDGTHQVRFYRDVPPNQEQLMMEITGDKLHMICRRAGLIDIPSTQYQKDIDELISISQGK